MTYQVLARKWRPRRFAELVEQSHVVQALTHALESGRLHHAYLLTGTRGVGKTTIARILAKSLNCERGVSASPCGECGACVEIDAGRFVDLLEVDAATNTRVDEMRQLLENAVYAPTRGRFKVYVIDEVHMLSNSAFNAMLKTLEEPPEHIKFVLATTDPQKIPVTVLSRCLQFGLRQVPVDSIESHLARICEKEDVSAERPGLRLIAEAARGSMRDALSLLDQAIAFCGGPVALDPVRVMLGSVDHGYLLTILEHLGVGALKDAIEVASELQSRSLSFDEALRGLAETLHRIALLQAVPTVALPSTVDRDRLVRLATALDPETVQLYYQIATHSRGELPLAPDEFAGFTMALVRMSCFRPDRPASGGKGLAPVGATAAGPAAASAKLARAPIVPRALAMSSAVAPPGSSVRPHADAVELKAVDSPSEAPEAPAFAPPSGRGGFDGDWPQLVRQMKLSGLVKQLAERSELVASGDGAIKLTVAPADRALAEKVYQDRLRQAVQETLGRSISVTVEIGKTSGTSVAAQADASQQARVRAAEQIMEQDGFVRDLVAEFDATIESIKPSQ